MASAQTPIFDLPAADALTASGTSMVTLRSGALAVSSALEGRVSILNMAERRLIAEIDIEGSPVSLSLVPDGTLLLALDARSDDVVLIAVEDYTVRRRLKLFAGSTLGSLLHLVAVANDAVLVLGERGLVELNLASGEIRPVLRDLQNLTGIAVWGDFIWASATDGSLYLANRFGGLVSRLSLPDSRFGAGSMAVNTRTGRLYAPYTYFNPDPQTPFDLAYVPYVAVVDLASFTFLPPLLLDVADTALHLPSAVRLTPDRARLLVTYQASARLGVIDLATQTRYNNVGTGAAPGALAFSRDASMVYVHNLADATISVFDTQFYTLADTLDVTTQPVLNVQQRWGLRLFYDAADPALAWNNSVSCNTCHSPAPSADALSLAGIAAAVGENQTTADFGRMLQPHLVNSQGGSGLNELQLAALVEFLRWHSQQPTTPALPR
jgi:DNA-binding beta-propeller fold protein YncE